MDTFSAAERSNIMRRVKSRNTKPERIVGRIARSFGYRQQRNRKGLPGSPDIVLPGKRMSTAAFGTDTPAQLRLCPRQTATKNIEYYDLDLATNRDEREAHIGWLISLEVRLARSAAARLWKLHRGVQRYRVRSGLKTCIDKKLSR